MMMSSALMPADSGLDFRTRRDSLTCGADSAFSEATSQKREHASPVVCPGA